MSNQGWGAPPPGGPPTGGPGAGAPPGARSFGVPPGEPPTGPFGGYTGAAPGTPFGHGSGGGSGGPQPWGIWDSFTFAWDRVKTDPATILGALIVGSLIANAFNLIGQGVSNIDREDPTIQIVVMGLNLVSGVVSSFMTGGMTLFAIKVARGDDYQFGDIFKGGPFFLNILGASILIGFSVLFGMILLVVPGIILALAWGLTIPLIVDKRQGAIDSMKASWNLMSGHKAPLFLWGLLVVALLLLGLLACCVGAMIVSSIAQVAFAYIYLRITGQRAAELSVAG